MQEIWKDIKGFEGYYQVSNLGRVKSLARTITKINGVKMPVKSCFLNVFKNSRNYYGVTLARDNKKHLRRIHRLVIETFVGQSNLQVNHIDGNKKNNKLENLEYSTSLENCNHREKVINKKEKYGITFEKKKKLWSAQINLKGKVLKLGRSKCKEKSYQKFYNFYLNYYGVAPW